VFVQPSGLIFLVIIAIWAAYLLQHWVRRREHLATARSVDRFSEAMRVLERRAPLLASDLSIPQPRSYSVTPARPSRSEVVVKRAHSPAPNVHARPAAPLRSPRVVHAIAGVSARRIRGLSLLALLAMVVVVLPLAAFSVLSWWSMIAVLFALVVDFAWLRHAAVADRARRQDEGRERPVQARLRPANARVRHADAPVRAATRGRSDPIARAEPVVADPVIGAAEVAERAESQAQSQADCQAECQSGSAVADLSGWAPVPVPPPTYTLKAKAERPGPLPATVAEPTTRPSSFDGLVEEDELDDLLDRRRAAGA
jgi:membrane protein implicated in regulation of membrane protease activity